MDLNYEKIAQAAVVGVIASQILKMLLAGQKVPNKKFAMPILSSMVASYFMGNKSLTLRGDENLQVYASAAIASYLYETM